jgi:membrane protease YdiL (CAAX protease family)
LTDPGPGPGPGPLPGAPIGLFRFTIEGRQAPGLYVAGWLASLVGGSAGIVGILAGASLGGAIVFVAGLGLLFAGLLLLGGSQLVERRAAGLAYPGPSPILVFGATIVGLYLAVVVVATPLEILDVRVDGPVLNLVGVVIQAAVVLLILRLLVVGPGALSWSDMGLRATVPGAIRELIWGAAFALPVIIVTSIAVGILVTVFQNAPDSPLPPTGTSAGLVLNLVAGAVIAPLYEELLFRGFATTAWARVVGPATAILRTSVLFAVAHVLTQGGETFGQAFAIAIVGAAGRLPVALVLGWLFVRRRSLWASVGLHAAFNGILLVVAEAALRDVPVG